MFFQHFKGKKRTFIRISNVVANSLTSQTRVH